MKPGQKSLHSHDFLLAKARTDMRTINSLQLSVLIANLYRAAKDPKIGFEDADRTFKEMELALLRPVSLPREVLESVLWGCNLLDEKGDFFHPADSSFDSFVKALLPGDHFNKEHHLIEKKNG